MYAIEPSPYHGKIDFELSQNIPNINLSLPLDRLTIIFMVRDLLNYRLRLIGVDS